MDIIFFVLLVTFLISQITAYFYVDAVSRYAEISTKKKLKEQISGIFIWPVQLLYLLENGKRNKPSMYGAVGWWIVGMFIISIFLYGRSDGNISIPLVICIEAFVTIVWLSLAYAFGTLLRAKKTGMSPFV